MFITPDFLSKITYTLWITNIWIFYSNAQDWNVYLKAW